MSNTMSSLPLKETANRSDKDVRLFFDRYYTKPINFSDNELNSVVSFFESRGFDSSAAIAVSVVLLNQAKLDNIKIFKLLDSLKATSEFKLSAVVAEVLNYNRKKTSAVGFKRTAVINKFEKRNIIEGTPAPVLINTISENNFSSTGYTFDSESITWDGE